MRRTRLGDGAAVLAVTCVAVPTVASRPAGPPFRHALRNWATGEPLELVSKRKHDTRVTLSLRRVAPRAERGVTLRSIVETAVVDLRPESAL